jgi:hypothetical protein
MSDFAAPTLRLAPISLMRYFEWVCDLIYGNDNGIMGVGRLQRRGAEKTSLAVEQGK